MGQSAFIQNGNPAWIAFNPVGSGGGSVGPYRFCTVSAVYAGGSGGGAAVYPTSGPNVYGQLIGTSMETRTPITGLHATID